MQSNDTKITRLIECDVCAERRIKYKWSKWSGFVDGENGFFYGIPSDALRVIKFNPIDKSIQVIGPNLGTDLLKWRVGVLSSRNGNIYCAPYNAKSVLVIDTTNDNVRELDAKLPELVDHGWSSGVLAADQNIYFFPYGAKRILKVDSQNDELSSVGNNLGNANEKYVGTVASKDGKIIYGIPYNSKRILKYDLSNPNTTALVGNEATKNFHCSGGVLGPDGNTIIAVRERGQILSIQTADNTWKLRGDLFYKKATMGTPIVGFDHNIYFPPAIYKQVLMYNPLTQEKSFVGDILTRNDGAYLKYKSGAITPNGFAYFPPLNGNHVLELYTGSHPIAPPPYTGDNSIDSSKNKIDVISNALLLFGIGAIVASIYLKRKRENNVTFEPIETTEIVTMKPQNDQVV